MRRALIFVSLVCLIGSAVTGCNREQRNLSQLDKIKTGMSFREVYAILGRPDIGFGLPQKCTKEKSWLFYAVPNEKYLVVNFVGDRVDDPPTSIESRHVVIE
jgi:hypothetical protein